MKKLGKLALQVAKCNCGARVNTLLLAAVPLVDQLQLVWPTLREHLPQNVYGYGFVALALLNVMMHVRATPPVLPDDQNPRQP